MERLVKVYLASDAFQAHAVRNLLEDAGIEARVEGAAMATAIPIGQATAPRIWVRQSDVERAREIIEQSEASRRETGPLEPAQAEQLDLSADTDPGSELASRALRAALLGVVLCPPTLNLYSAYLLLSAAWCGAEFDASAGWKLFAAFVVDALVITVAVAILLSF